MREDQRDVSQTTKRPLSREAAEVLLEVSLALAEAEIKRLREELDAARADIAMLIQKQTDHLNG